MSNNWKSIRQGAPIALLVLLFSAASATAEGRRWALLIGINDYALLNDLQFAKNDALSLKEQLVKFGFDEERVYVMTDDSEARYRPYRNTIERQLNNLLGLARREDDMLLIAFSGHGMHINGKSYFCPVDADPQKPAETMIEINGFYERLLKCPAAMKILLVDACRDNPQGGIKSVADAPFEKGVRTPKGIVQLSSCSEDQVSIEDPKLKHGIFTYYVLEAIAKGDKNGDGAVTVEELAEYVSEKTELRANNEFSRQQYPSLKAQPKTFAYAITGRLSHIPPALVPNPIPKIFDLSHYQDLVKQARDELVNNDRPETAIETYGIVVESLADADQGTAADKLRKEVLTERANLRKQLGTSDELAAAVADLQEAGKEAQLIVERDATVWVMSSAGVFRQVDTIRKGTMVLARSVYGKKHFIIDWQNQTAYLAIENCTPDTATRVPRIALVKLKLVLSAQDWNMFYGDLVSGRLSDTRKDEYVRVFTNKYGQKAGTAIETYWRNAPKTTQ